MLVKLISLVNIIMDSLAETLRNAISGLQKTFRRTLSYNTPVSLTEMETISLIYKNKSILPSELAKKTKVTTPSMSQILKKMERMNIIQRTPSKDDGRKMFVSLTDIGKQTIEQAHAGKNAILNHLIKTKLTNNEIKILEQAVPVLQKLNAE